MSNPNDKRFLVDGMLGNIVKKLRLMGFDSEFAKNKSDNDVMKMMEEQNRILITKDEELAKRAKKLGFEPIFMTGDDEYLHFREIKEKLKLKFSIRGETSRCTVCNGKLNSVEKDLIKNKIPGKVVEHEKNFWQCSVCKKIYWEGTHINRLQNFIGKINE